LNDLKWTANNLLHLLLGDEKKMSVPEWYFYLCKQIDKYSEEFYNEGLLDEDDEHVQENFNPAPCFDYAIECLRAFPGLHN
jgi:hypothetical protein